MFLLSPLHPEFLTSLETGLGLDVVMWLQAHGSPFADLLARLLHVLGFDVVYLLTGGALYLWGDRQRAGRWIFALVVTSLAVGLLKVLFAAPRPYQVAPDDVLLLVNQSGYGLPSGHVAHVVAAFGLVGVWYRRWWIWGVGVIYTLLMAWGRMYAGAHFPQDVIAGVLLGIFCLWFTLRYYERAAAHWNQLPMALRVGLVVLIVLVFGLPIF
jgi:membrane-associated phospholipid phosphatase